MKNLKKLQDWLQQHKDEVIGTDGIKFCYALIEAFPEVSHVYLSDKGNFISFYLDGIKIILNFNEEVLIDK